MNEQKSFKLHWLDGKTEVVSGFDIAHAFTMAGYGAGAIRAGLLRKNGGD